MSYVNMILSTKTAGAEANFTITIMYKKRKAISETEDKTDKERRLVIRKCWNWAALYMIRAPCI